MEHQHLPTSGKYEPMFHVNQVPQFPPAVRPHTAPGPLVNNIHSLPRMNYHQGPQWPYNMVPNRLPPQMEEYPYHDPSQQTLEDSEMLLEESDYSGYHLTFPEEDELAEGMIPPRAVHQCNVCEKIFVSFKGLQQHAVIHTDQKPYQCDVCAKAFRFKSNLFEHRSVHTGFLPHACPYCGKTCRLKGNLKKHLRTHVTTKEELDAAWRPFASNRRPAADIPGDAVIVRGTGGPYYTPPSKPRKKKLGLGPDARTWIERLKRGEILPEVELHEKVRRLEEALFHTNDIKVSTVLFEHAKAIAFETHECPSCKGQFLSRMDCINHHNLEHQNDVDLFCEKCFRPFADVMSLQQHESYHNRVSTMIANGSVSRAEPQILIPTPEEINLVFDTHHQDNMIMEPHTLAV